MMSAEVTPVRCREPANTEVAATAEMRTSAEAAATELRTAANMRTATAEMTSTPAKVDTAAAEMASAATKVTTTSKMATASTHVATPSTTPTHVTAAVWLGERGRAAQGKRRNDCQHCPTHRFSSLCRGCLAERAAAEAVAIKMGWELAVADFSPNGNG